MKHAKEKAQTLKAKSYQELQQEMSSLPTAELIELLGIKSTKIGDTASSLINQRSGCEQVAQAVLEGKFTTVNGKVRASNTLWFGRADTVSGNEAFLRLSQDKNEEVAGTALLALVAMRKIQMIPKLESVVSDPHISANIKNKIVLAIKALENDNPKIFSPCYG